MDNSAKALVEVIGSYTPRQQIIVFIMNTLSWYKNNARSVLDGKSYYRHPTLSEVKCSIGRFIEDDVYTEDIEPKFIGQIKDIIHPSLHQLIDNGNIHFVARVHDDDVYWKDNQLSTTGLIFLGNTFGLNTNELYNILSIYKRQDEQTKDSKPTTSND